jgi:ubiquitin C-terminal hydrolase
MSGGHYVAYTCYDEKGERNWYYISDSHFGKVEESQALNAEGYILFYKRVPATEVYPEE